MTYGAKKVVRIVTFYDDGTFSESVPSPYIPAMPYTPPAYPYPWTPDVGPRWTVTPYCYNNASANTSVSGT